MVGARGHHKRLHYPVNETAGRFGASAEEATTNPAEACARWSSEFTSVEIEWPP